VTTEEDLCMGGGDKRLPLLVAAAAALGSVAPGPSAISAG